jgi:hypothetical protein
MSDIVEPVAPVEATPPPPDELVPNSKVWREFGVCSMTLRRWDADPEMAAIGWQQPVKIRNRWFRSRNGLERFKGHLLRIAINKHGRR